MIQWKKDNLPTRQEKEAEAKFLSTPSAANEKRLTDIETALCELDAALNKE